MAMNFHDRRSSQQSATSSASALSSRVTSKVKQLVRKFEDLDRNYGREKKRVKFPENDSHSRFWSTPVTIQRYRHARLTSKSNSYKPISSLYSGKRHRGIPNQDGPADTVPPEPSNSTGTTVTTSPNGTRTAEAPRKRSRKTTPIHETDEAHSNPRPEENVIKRRATIFSRLASHRKKATQQEPRTVASFDDQQNWNVGSPEDHALSSSAKRSVAARRSTSIRTGVKAIIAIFNRRRGQDTTPPSNQVKVAPDNPDEESLLKASPDNVDNYRGVEFKKLDRTSRKTRQSSSGFNYPSGVLPPGFFESRCSSIDITTATASDQQGSTPHGKKYILNPSYVRQQLYNKDQSENSAMRQKQPLHPTGPAKAGLLYSHNSSASTISLSFREVEQALTQRSSPSHKSMKSGIKLSATHNPSSLGNNQQKVKAASESELERSQGESTSAHTQDLTVTISTGRKTNVDAPYGHHGPLFGPSSEETWSSRYNLSASYSTNSVGSFAILHNETDVLLQPDETDWETRAVGTPLQFNEKTSSPGSEGTTGIFTRSTTGITLPTFHRAPSRSTQKSVRIEDPTLGNVQLRVDIVTDPSSRRYNNTPLQNCSGFELKSDEDTPDENVAFSLGSQERRWAGTPIPTYWVEDRRLGNGTAYCSSVICDTGTPIEGPAKEQSTPAKYIDRRTTPEGYYLRHLPQPRVRVLTENDAEFYDNSSFEGNSDSDSDEENLSAKDIAILDSAGDFRTSDSDVGCSYGGISLTASHQSLESLPEDASPEEEISPEEPINESSSPTSVYSQSEGSDGGSNHTVHINLTPGNSSGSGDTLVSTGGASRSSNPAGTPVHPIIGDAGEMTLGELAAYLAGPSAAGNLQDGAASMTVHVPIMGMPPRRLQSPQPRSINQVKEIRKLIFRWSSDSPVVDFGLAQSRS
ncbi:MAG: hypothetical protein M1812_007612 [Candelaria pacifica]|nr:MAG: hypothetical protein M1812_007612 [Candelaria pacifica]